MKIMNDCYQVNQGIKSILVRHYADLSSLDFSLIGSTMYLSGTLKKDPSGEFTASGLEAMLREIVRIPGVHGLQADLDNWVISYTGAGFELHRKHRPQGSSGASQTVRIARQEDVQDVLDGIQYDSDSDHTEV
jgi:hypothetical protein